MSRAHRRFAVCGSAALVTAAVAAIPAFGAVVKYDSKVTIRSTAPAFHGHVSSESPACEPRRRVKLFKQRPGTDKLLGKDRTDHEGRWKIEVEPLKSGAYYAKVTRRAEGAAGTTFVCKRDRSKTVVVD